MFINSNATFTMKGGKISENTAESNDRPYCGGGGVFVDNNATFIMEGGKISNNTTADLGGGVSVYGIFTMKDGEISENTLTDVPSFRDGGGVFVAGIFTMENGKISSNDNYGVMVNIQGTFIMENGEISNNTITNEPKNIYGGGVDVSGIFTMKDGKISNNTSGTVGGGVCVNYDSTFIMEGGEISNNTAYSGGGVCVCDDATFTMNGGSIINNKVEEDALIYGKFVCGGGVCINSTYVGSTTTFNVSGNAIITNNTRKKDTTLLNNVYLPENAVINVIDKLGEEANIGVTVADEPTEGNRRKIAEGKDYTILSGEEAKFESDNPDYKTIFSKSAIYLGLLSDTKQDVTVTFNYQHNGINNKNIYVDAGEKVTAPSPNPTREGYTLEDWYTDKDCTNGKEWDFNTPVTADITLFAKWTENEYDVTFNSQGGSPTPERQKVKHSEKATKPTTDPTKTGFTFDGWFTDEDCTQAYDFSTPVTESFTLYAKWTENTTPPEAEEVTVNFNSQGGSHINPITVAKNNTITKPTDPTKKDCKFEGWYQNAACTGEKWDFSTEVTKNMTLYAKWTENNTEDPTPTTKYTVTFDSQGGSSIPSQEVEKDKQATKPTNPTRTGFTFNDWYTDKDCTQTYDFNTSVTKSFTLYAKWTENKTTPPVEPVDPVKPTQPTTKYYTVTFDSNGGTEIANQTVSYGRTATMPKNPTKNGYEFLGWFADKEFNEIYRFSTPVIKDTTIYAKWKSNGTAESYIVTFDSNGGSKITSQTIETGKTATMPKNPTKSGYEFLGWFADDNFDKVYRFSTPVTEDITIYAK